ncbi:TMEM43 [Bugula neritina]|uniref:TMEM43 n=1 Tax=Bugula neritina TaxID=10212 RepID=A0A7J7JL25_BUGNE|nr:TMEM43 [Bugula neritina]
MFTVSYIELVAEINEYHDLTPTVVPDGLSHVGDVRVAFSYAGLCKDSKLGQAQLVSVMAMQDGFTLTGYQTEAGNVLEMISLSHKSPEEMVSSAHSQNNLMTWLIRGAGLFINFLGFTCLTSLIRTLVSYIPIIRELVYISVTSFNISLSVSLSLVTIALSWIIYRPTMALSIIALAAGFIIIPRLRISSDLPSQGRRFV